MPSVIAITMSRISRRLRLTFFFAWNNSTAPHIPSFYCSSLFGQTGTTKTGVDADDNCDSVRRKFIYNICMHKSLSGRKTHVDIYLCNVYMSSNMYIVCMPKKYARENCLNCLNLILVSEARLYRVGSDNGGCYRFLLSFVRNNIFAIKWSSNMCESIWTGQSFSFKIIEKARWSDFIVAGILLLFGVCKSRFSRLPINE